MPAQSFDIIDQGADANIRTMLNLGNFTLVHPEGITELQLRHLSRPPDLV